MEEASLKETLRLQILELNGHYSQDNLSKNGSETNPANSHLESTIANSVAKPADTRMVFEGPSKVSSPLNSVGKRKGVASLENRSNQLVTQGSRITGHWRAPRRNRNDAIR